VHRLSWDCWEPASKGTQSEVAKKFATDMDGMCQWRSGHRLVVYVSIPSYILHNESWSVISGSKCPTKHFNFNLCQLRMHNLQSRSCSSKPRPASRGLHCDDKGNHAIDWKTSSFFDNTSDKCTDRHLTPTATHPLDAGLVIVPTLTVIPYLVRHFFVLI
jgi:hypothetical protein